MRKGRDVALNFSSWVRQYQPIYISTFPQKFGERAFLFVGLAIWNALPNYVPKKTENSSVHVGI